VTQSTRPGDLSSPDRGFIIVAVLWLVAALAALAVIFSGYLSSSARSLALNDRALEALVSAGVELAAYQLQLAGKDARPSRGVFQARLNGAELAVTFVSEAARLDLNAAPKELLANLLTVLGAQRDDARQFADRIAGWRTGATPESAGHEDALYLAAGRSYTPRQAPFAHVNELGLVLGPPPALVERALPFLTVFSGAPGIDVLSAPPELIAALPGMTPLTLKEFLRDRASLPNDPAAIAAALGGAKAFATVQKSQAYRLLIGVHLQNGRRAAAEVVISLDGQEDPYRVLSWQDDVSLNRRAKL
jgi:general secretion pathway protein K